MNQQERPAAARRLCLTVTALAGSALLTACASVNNAIRIDGSAIQPGSSAAALEIYPHAVADRTQGPYLWSAELVSVDGKAVPQTTKRYLQVSAGSHSLNYRCSYRLNVSGADVPQRGASTITADLSANGIYFPQVEAQPHDIYSNPIMQSGVMVQAGGACLIEHLNIEDPATRK